MADWSKETIGNPVYRLPTFTSASILYLMDFIGKYTWIEPLSKRIDLRLHISSLYRTIKTVTEINDKTKQCSVQFNKSNTLCQNLVINVVNVVNVLPCPCSCLPPEKVVSPQPQKRMNDQGRKTWWREIKGWKKLIVQFVIRTQADKRIDNKYISFKNTMAARIIHSRKSWGIKSAN